MGMETDQFVKNFSNALAFEAKRTEGIELTQLLEYKIGIVITNGKIVGTTIDKMIDSLVDSPGNVLELKTK